MEKYTIWIQIIIGALAFSGVLGYQIFTFRRQNQQLDQKVPKELCEDRHASHNKEFEELKDSVGDVIEALQGKTGKTGLVADIRFIKDTVKKVRHFQENGGDE